MSKSPDAQAHQVEFIVKAIHEFVKPLLAGQEPSLQSAVLADLTAMWLAGHFSTDRKTTDKLRTMLLMNHVKLIKQLIPLNEAAILEATKRTSN